MDVEDLLDARLGYRLSEAVARQLLEGVALDEKWLLERTQAWFVGVGCQVAVATGCLLVAVLAQCSH